jgi:type 1 fimbria pilin
MKQNHGSAWRWAAIAAVLAVSMCRPIRADDRLAFDVTGAVTPSCGLAQEHVRIDLGTVAFAELGEMGAGSTWHRGVFSGVDCVGATRASVTLRARAYGPDPRYLAAAGGARGVAIEMQTEAGEPVLPDGRSPVGFDWADGVPRLAFEARYVRVGPLGAGDAAATAIVEITWE